MDQSVPAEAAPRGGVLISLEDVQRIDPEDEDVERVVQCRTAGTVFTVADLVRNLHAALAREKRVRDLLDGGDVNTDSLRNALGV